MEHFTARVTDGIGNNIAGSGYGRTITDIAVPGTLSNYHHTPPVANPITVTIISPAGGGLEEEVTLVIEGNCPTLPSPADVRPADFTTDIGDTVTGDLSDFATDPNGFPLTYQMHTMPSIVSITLSTDGTFTYTANMLGIETFIVNVNNSVGQVVARPVTITVTEAEVVPPVVDLPAENPPTKPATNQLAATGSEGLASLTLTGIAAAALGLVLMRPRRKA